jgi:hypothetical protein
VGCQSVVWGVLLRAGVMGKGEGEEGFAAAGGPDNEHVLVLTDPGCGGKSGEKRLVKAREWP